MTAPSVLPTEESPGNPPITYCLQKESSNRGGDPIIVFSPLLPGDKTLKISVISFMSVIHPT